MEHSQIPSHVPSHLVRDESWWPAHDESGDPNARFANYAKETPIAFISPCSRFPAGSWVLFHYEDMHHVLTDSEHFTNHRISGYDHLVGSHELLIPIEFDPPQHSKYRAILAPYFSPSRVRGIQEVMERGVSDIIDSFIDQGEADLVPYGYRMMGKTWCAIMGVPEDNVELYIRFLWDMVHQFNPEVQIRCLADMRLAMEEIYNDFLGKPVQGLIGHFVNSEVNGKPLSKEECVGFIIFMFFAGMDTMGSTSTWILRHLAVDTKMRETLTRRSELLPTYIDEMTRRYSVTSTRRRVKADIEMHGVKLKADDFVLLPTRFGGLDPDVCERPLDVDLERTDRRHLGFGAGPHFCIGAPVARAQLPIMVKTWLRKIPSFRIQQGAKLTAHVGDVVGLDSLPLEWPAN